MTDIDRRQIKMLWESRVPISRIVQMLPYKKVIAKKMIDELRQDGTLQKRNRKKTAIKAVGEMWESGTQNIDELSEIFGYSPRTIILYLSLSREGKDRPAHNYRKRKLNEKALEIIKEISNGKLTLSEISRKFDVSRQYVYQLKKKVEE